MANDAPAQVVKHIDNQVSMILRTINQHELSEKPKKALVKLKQALIDARVYSRDYELSETREEQIDNAKKANKYLEQIRQSILRTSEFNVFGPIDVALITAQIDSAKADLK